MAQQTSGHYIYKHKRGFSCEIVKRVAVADTVTPEGYKVYRIRGFVLRVCECGKTQQGHLVNGRYSDKILCGAKCRSSKGPSCECHCGGKDHGSNY